MAEAALASWDGESKTPSLMLQCPGWRVVNGNADPVVAARRCAEAIERSTLSSADSKAAWLSFFRRLVVLVESDGRDAAITWMVERRTAQLDELGYGDNSIVG